MVDLWLILCVVLGNFKYVELFVAVVCGVVVELFVAPADLELVCLL